MPEKDEEEVVAGAVGGASAGAAGAGASACILSLSELKWDIWKHIAMAMTICNNANLEMKCGISV